MEVQFLQASKGQHSLQGPQVMVHWQAASESLLFQVLYLQIWQDSHQNFISKKLSGRDRSFHLFSRC
jgi:hypothetical protein